MALTINLIGGSVQLSGNDIFVQCSTDRPSTGISEQKMLLKITSDDGDVVGGPWIDAIAGTNVKFNVSAIVNAPVDVEFDYADSGQYFNRAANIFNFGLQVGEQYTDGNGDIQQVWGNAVHLDVLKGKLTKLQRAVLTENSSSFFDYYITNGRFLSYMNGKEITVASVSDPVKMWLTKLGTTAVDVFYQISYSTGAPDAGSITITHANTRSVTEINCHKIIIDNCDTNRTVNSYRLFTSDSADIKVNVTNIYHDETAVLFFYTRRGSVESFNLYGDVSEGFESESETFTKAASSSPSVLEATSVQQSKKSSEPFTLNTNYITLDERRWLKDLLSSPVKMVYLKSSRVENLIGKNYGIAPVVITTNSVTIDSTQDDLVAIPIQLVIAHND